MEILRAKVEVSRSSTMPATAEYQFVVLKSLGPKIKSITISTEDPEVSRNLKDHKQLTIVILDGEDEQ